MQKVHKKLICWILIATGILLDALSAITDVWIVYRIASLFWLGGFILLGQVVKDKTGHKSAQVHKTEDKTGDADRG